VPRVINILCDGALLLGFAKDRPTLSAEEVCEVAHDLGLGSSTPVGGPDEGHSPARQRRSLFGFLRPRQARGA
jgi:hypothetical protein